MKVRRPAVAGQFYEGTPERLKAHIASIFLDKKLGPGEIPSKMGNERGIVSCVVPHAGYMFSGYTAAHVYLALFSDGKPETFVIIGPNHTGLGPGVSVFPGGRWETPLGQVEVDEELSSLITSFSDASADESAHFYEHSVEVQLPFLQFLYGGDFKIVPIVMLDQGSEVSKDLAGGIKRAVEELGRDVVVIASSDFSHYVPKHVAEELDNLAMKRIVEKDVSGFYQTVINHRISICGYGPIAVSMHWAVFHQASGRLLHYSTSGDVVPSLEVVGYGGIIFSR